MRNHSLTSDHFSLHIRWKTMYSLHSSARWNHFLSSMYIRPALEWVYSPSELQLIHDKLLRQPMRPNFSPTPSASWKECSTKLRKNHHLSFDLVWAQSLLYNFHPSVNCYVSARPYYLMCPENPSIRSLQSHGCLRDHKKGLSLYKGLTASPNLLVKVFCWRDHILLGA